MCELTRLALEKGKLLKLRLYDLFVECGSFLRASRNNTKGDRMNELVEWYEDIEEAYVESGIDSKVYRTYYKDVHIKVYPLTLWHRQALGWEYELYSEQRNIDWDSLHETANTGILIDNIGDHAHNPEQAMKWAVRTVDEWDEQQ